MNLFLHAGKTRLSVNDSAVVHDLANKADIVVLEARSADEIDSFGFDEWQAPIKVAITPFGRTGPRKNWAATPSTILAAGGYTNLMGDQEREPLTVPGHYVEFQSGGFAYTAASACAYGEVVDTIDIGMLEVVMALSQFTTVLWHCARVVRSRHGNDFWSVVPTNLFRCSDGWVYINIVPGFWDSFTIFLGMPELTLDERFQTNGLRMQNRDALHEIVAEEFLQWDRKTIQERAEAARIPVGASLDFFEVLKDPHLSERDVWQTIHDGEDRTVLSPHLPFHLRELQAPYLVLRAVEELPAG